MDNSSQFYNTIITKMKKISTFLSKIILIIYILFKIKADGGEKRIFLFLKKLFDKERLSIYNIVAIVSVAVKVSVTKL